MQLNIMPLVKKMGNKEILSLETGIKIDTIRNIIKNKTCKLDNYFKLANCAKKKNVNIIDNQLYIDYTDV